MSTPTLPGEQLTFEVSADQWSANPDLLQRGHEIIQDKDYLASIASRIAVYNSISTNETVFPSEAEQTSNAMEVLQQELDEQRIDRPTYLAAVFSLSELRPEDRKSRFLQLRITYRALPSTVVDSLYVNYQNVRSETTRTIED